MNQWVTSRPYQESSGFRVGWDIFAVRGYRFFDSGKGKGIKFFKQNLLFHIVLCKLSHRTACFFDISVLEASLMFHKRATNLEFERLMLRLQYFGNLIFHFENIIF